MPNAGEHPPYPIFAAMPAKPDPFLALRQGNFRKFLASRLYFSLAIQMQFVLAGWLIYQYTHQALSLGLLGLCEAVPAIGVALFGGHVADIFSRKKIIMLCIMVLIVSFSILWILLFKIDAGLKQTWVVVLYGVFIVNGITRGFMSPAQASFIVQTVSRDALPNASSWNSMVWQTSSIAGPALGGLILGLLGEKTAYGIVVALMLLALLNYFGIRQHTPQQKKEREPLKTSLTSGLRFVFANPVMLGSFSLDLFAVLFGGVMAVLPIFASDVLHVGAKGFGFLRAAMAIGAISTAAVLAYAPPLRKSGIKLFAAVAVFGICMIVFAFSRNYYLSFSLLVLAGMADEVSVFIRTNILQLMTPDDIRGRVSSVSTIFISSSNEIGAFESGMGANYLGLVPSVVFGGCVTLVVVFAFLKITPQLYKLDLKRFHAAQLSLVDNA